MKRGLSGDCNTMRRLLIKTDEETLFCLADLIIQITGAYPYVNRAAPLYMTRGNISELQTYGGASKLEVVRWSQAEGRVILLLSE